MFNKDNVFIAVNEEVSSIIQQYIIREIKKVLDKYKSITTEEISSVEKLINSISNEELKEEFLNDWSMSVKIAKEIGENEVDDRIISMYQNLKSNGLEELSIGHVINWCNELDEQGYIFCDGDCLKELSKIINDSKNIDILETYKSLIDNKESLFSSKCEVTIEDIINLDLKDLKIINKNNYPLLNRTLIYTLNYLILRLKVEKVLIEKYNIEIKENMLLQEIIMSAFKENKDDSNEKIKKKTKDRVFFTSRKTLLNEFNHFEGNMNIFQPVIDITNKALEKERESIIEYLENLEN